MKKLLSLTLLGALLLTACSTGGEDLQGRFGSPTLVAPAVMTMSLSSSSPSGFHSSSSVDDFLYVDIKFDKKTTLSAGSEFRVDLSIDGSGEGDPAKGSFDTAVSGEPILLYNAGTLIGTGTFTIIDLTNPYEGVAYVTTTKAITFKAGATQTLYFTSNTANLIAEESAAFDVMTAKVEYNGQKVAGNALKY